MALKVNSTAPDFTLPSTSGHDFTLSKDVAQMPCIIYFYPKDFTPACTKEACEFRDAFETFRDMDIAIYGISTDDIPTHLKFKKAQNLPFELLADTEGKVAKLYGATLPLVKFTRRITYLLDKNHVVVAVYENLFGATRHIQVMIDKVKA